MPSRKKHFANQSIMKKTNIHLKAVLLLSLLALIGAAENAKAQETQPRLKLGAYYFAGWCGTCRQDDGKPEHAWAKGMPSHISQKLLTEFAGRTPLWGWREDAPGVMERQIDLAADNGVAYFAFDWYWTHHKGDPFKVDAVEPGRDSLNLPLLQFMKAKNNKRMEFCLLVVNERGDAIESPAAWKQTTDYWVTLFKHPSYLRVAGKPLLLIYKPKDITAEEMAYLQKAAKAAGFPGVAVAACGSGKPEDGFSLLTHYNVTPQGTWTFHKSEEHSYQEVVEANVKAWKGGTPAQPLIPLVTAGWDRRPWEGVGGYSEHGVEVSWYFTSRTPAAFGGLLDRLANWMDANPTQVTKDRLALVYAWNETGEGGWLVPCRDDPDAAYLKAIRKVVFRK